MKDNLLSHFEAFYQFCATSYLTLLKTFGSLPTLNFGMLVGFITSKRSIKIFCNTSKRPSRVLETLVGPCVFGAICSRGTTLLTLGKMRSIDKSLWVQECCKHERESCITFKNYPRTFFATKILIDCPFLSKNCSSGSPEFTKVAC